MIPIPFPHYYYYHFLFLKILHSSKLSSAPFLPRSSHRRLCGVLVLPVVALTSQQPKDPPYTGIRWLLVAKRGKQTVFTVSFLPQPFLLEDS